MDIPLELIERNDLDSDIRADALLKLKNDIHLEYEHTRKNSQALQRRMDVYLEVDDLVLWVAGSEKRIETIKKYAEGISDRALFGVLGQPLWQDINGETIHWSLL